MWENLNSSFHFLKFDTPCAYFWYKNQSNSWKSWPQSNNQYANIFLAKSPIQQSIRIQKSVQQCVQQSIPQWIPLILIIRIRIQHEYEPAFRGQGVEPRPGCRYFLFFLKTRGLASVPLENNPVIDMNF